MRDLLHYDIGFDWRFARARGRQDHTVAVELLRLLVLRVATQTPAQLRGLLFLSDAHLDTLFTLSSLCNDDNIRWYYLRSVLSRSFRQPDYVLAKRGYPSNWTFCLPAISNNVTIWHGPFRALSLPPSWDDYNKQNTDPLFDRANEWLKRPLLKAKGHQVVKRCAQEMSAEDTISTSASDSPRHILGGSAQEDNIVIHPSTLVGHPTKRRRISTGESVPTAKDMSLLELFDEFQLPARTFADTLAREGKYGACIACGNMLLLKSQMSDMLTHLVGKGRVNCPVFKLLGIQYQGRAGPATIGWYFKDFERFAVWTLKRHPELVEVLKDGSYKYPQMAITSFLRQDAKEWWAGQPQLHNLKGQELTNALDVLAQGITLQVAI